MSALQDGESRALCFRFRDSGRTGAPFDGSGAAKCEVIEAAFGNAHHALRDRFETWDEADRQGVAERKRNETFFG